MAVHGQERDMHKGLIQYRYRMVRKLGEGGFADVFLVEDCLNHGQRLALKYFKSYLDIPRYIDLFRREFAIIASLRHPNLVTVHDFSFDSGQERYFMTMECVPGETLRHWLRKQTTKGAGHDKHHVLLSLCRVLQFIHARQVIHRDIKPQNVMVNGSGVKLMDFGLAGRLGKEAAKTRGTLMYMAPECLGKGVDIRADIFAFGLLAYELYTRRPFFSGSKPANIKALLADRQAFLSYKQAKLAQVPLRMRNWLDKLLAYDAHERYASCAEIVAGMNGVFDRQSPIETRASSRAYTNHVPFQDRGPEMVYLKRALIAQPEKARFTLVEGRAGAGRSRLLQEFIAACRGMEIPVFTCLCDPQDPRYGPFRQLLAHMLCQASKALVETHEPWLKELLPSHPRLASLAIDCFCPAHGAGNNPAQNIAAAIAQFALEQTDRLVVYIARLHCMEPGSREVLQNLLSAMQRNAGLAAKCRVYASALYERKDDAVSFIGALKKADRLTAIKVPPLSAKAVHRMVRAAFGTDCLGASFSGAIPRMVKRVGGNPLFLLLWLRSMCDQDVLQRSPTEWQITPRWDENPPGEVRAMIKAHLQEVPLTREYRSWLYTLALLNRDAALAEFVYLVHGRAGDIEAFFAHLQAHDVLEVVACAEDVRYGLSCSVLTETILESLELQEKRRLHGLLARRLLAYHEHAGPSLLQEAAYHAGRGGQREKQTECLAKAAEHAYRLGHFQQALAIYEELLTLAERWPETLRYSNGKGRILQDLGAWDDAMALFKANLNQCKRLRDVAGSIDCDIALSELLAAKGMVAAARSHALHAQELAMENVLPAGLAAAYGCLGDIALLEYEYAAAMKYYLKQLTVKEKDGTHSAAQAVGSLGNVYFEQGEEKKAIQYYELMLEMAQQTGDEKMLCTGFSNMGRVYFHRCDYEQAKSYFYRSLNKARQLGYKKSIATTLHNLGLLHYNLADYQQSLQCYQTMLALCEGMGYKYGKCRATGQLGNIFLYLGQYSKALRCYKRKLELCREMEDKKGVCSAVGAIGLIAYYGGKDKEAEHAFRQQLALGRQLCAYDQIAAAQVQLGQLHHTRGRYGKALMYYQQALVLDHGQRNKRGVCHDLCCLADLHRQSGQRGKAQRCLSHAIDMAEVLGMRDLLCRALYLHGEALFGDDPDRAGSEARKAVALARQINYKHVLFNGQVLLCRLDYAAGQQRRAIGRLKELMPHWPDAEHQASIYYELGRMTKQAFYRHRARTLYVRLYAEKPNILYKQKADATGGSRFI